MTSHVRNPIHSNISSYFAPSDTQKLRRRRKSIASFIGAECIHRFRGLKAFAVDIQRGGRLVIYGINKERTKEKKRIALEINFNEIFYADSYTRTAYHIAHFVVKRVQ